MHILYVGSSGAATALWLGEALVQAGHRFSFLNHSPSFFEPGPGVDALTEGRYLNLRIGPEERLSEESGGLRRRVDALLAPLGLGLDRSVDRRLSAWLRPLDVDMVFSQWGTVALPAIRCLRRVRPELPVVHEFLSYPTDWFGAAERVNDYYRPVIEGLAGRIYCSDTMRSYFAARFEQGRSLEMVRHARYPRRAFPRERLPRIGSGGEPHVVCLATFDYKRQRGDVNDIAPRLLDLADAGIHVHALQADGAEPIHERIHRFERLDPTDGALATFGTGFDACLVTYNLSNPALDRAQFQNSLPERFLYALVLGIPIVLPRGELPSCEHLVVERGIGFAFGSAPELASWLRDEPATSACRERAARYAETLTLEENLPELVDFFGKVARHYRDGDV